MLSKIGAKKTETGNKNTDFVKESKKIANLNHKFEIKLASKTLASQLVRNSDALVYRFVRNESELRDYASIRANRSEVTDETLRMLAKQMKSLKKIRKVEINCERCRQITDEGLKNLGEGLAKLSSVRSISLIFRKGYDFTDEGVKSLSEGLRKLGSLRSLNLIFDRYYQITDKGLKYLSQGLKRLYSLQSLSMDFTECPGLSDDGLKSLSEGLRKLSSFRFQSINLRFIGCSKITDRGYNDVFKTISSLKSIKLDFGRTGITLKNLEKTLQGLNFLSLINLSLRYHGCYYITDESLSYLSKYLIDLSSLQSIDLDFCLCGKITDGGVKNLGKCLERLDSLKSIHFDFALCNISSECLRNLNDMLCHGRNITIHPTWKWEGK